MFTTKGSLVIQGDRGRLQVAIRNLIKNALMFTNSSGRVVVRVEEVPGYVRVSVTDTGIGIPPAEQEKIFQRFYQVEKHLTRRHGGWGWVYPLPGTWWNATAGKSWWRAWRAGEAGSPFFCRRTGAGS
jgi:signal transduction histidine kinase